MIDISIIIVTYNSKWFELKATIKSVLMQKGINYEIIFADDGSKIKWNEKIREYVKGDYNYKCVESIKRKIYKSDFSWRLFKWKVGNKKMD